MGTKPGDDAAASMQLMVPLPSSATFRTEVLLSGPQGQRRPRAGIAKGRLDQKGLVHPTEVVEYKIP